MSFISVCDVLESAGSSSIGSNGSVFHTLREVKSIEVQHLNKEMHGGR